MRLPNVKILLCCPSRTQIYGFVENHTFLEQFVSMGVRAHFSNLGVPAHFSSLGVPVHFSNLGVPAHFSNLGVPAHFSNGGHQHNFPIWGTSTIFQSGGTSTIFLTLQGSFWLGKDKGSIMRSAESGGTIHLETNLCHVPHLSKSYLVPEVWRPIF